MVAAIAVVESECLGWAESTTPNFEAPSHYISVTPLPAQALSTISNIVETVSILFSPYMLFIRCFKDARMHVDYPNRVTA